SGAAAGSQAIAQAFWTVLHNRADLMLCQTADAPEQWFSANPPAEIGGAVVLESWEGAQRRGAAVLAEVIADKDRPEPSPFALTTSDVGSPVPRFMAALLEVNRATGRLGGAAPRIQLSTLLGGATLATAPGALA